MDVFEYRFSSKTGDIYIVRILNDGARFLLSEMISALTLMGTSPEVILSKIE